MDVHELALNNLLLGPVSVRQAKSIVGEISPHIVERLIKIFSRCGDSDFRQKLAMEISKYMQLIARVKLGRHRRPSSAQMYEWLVFDCPGWYDTEHAEDELADGGVDPSELSLTPEELMTRIIFILDKIAKAVTNAEEVSYTRLCLHRCMPEWQEYLLD